MRAHPSGAAPSETALSDPTSLQQAHYVLPSQLCVGMHVNLELNWSEHPFTFSSFVIKSPDQIDKIRALNLPRVRWNPDKSTARPLAPPARRDAPASAPAAAAPRVDTAEIKRVLAAKLTEHASRRESCQRALTGAAKTMKSIGSQALKNPTVALAEGTRLVEQVASLMPESHEIAIHLMADQVGGEEVYHHSLNVTLLSMMLGRELKLSDADLRTLGQGALFHDVGKMEIADKVVRKVGPLTVPERNLMKTHVVKGGEVVGRMAMSPHAALVVAQHHEYADGSGYPARLKGDAISPLARIVAVVNEFDGLCNPADPTHALTPHEALSQIYGTWRNRFDPRTVATFVRCMGIYPPGTIVGLSQGAIGMVVSVNSSRPLKPVVMLFDPSVAKESAPVLDLEGIPDVSVVRTLRPSGLPPEAFAYLAPQRRLTYFFDTQPRVAGA